MRDLTDIDRAHILYVFTYTAQHGRSPHPTEVAARFGTDVATADRRHLELCGMGAFRGLASLRREAGKQAA